MGPALSIELVKFIEPQTGMVVWRAKLPEVGVMVIDSSIIGCINTLSHAIPSLRSEAVLHGRN